MDRYRQNWPDPGHDQAPADDGGIEFLEDRTRPIAARHTGSRFSVSLPGAIAGAFLITAIAFGAAIRAEPTSSNGTTEQPRAAVVPSDMDDPAGDGTLAGNGTTGSGTDKNPGGDADPAIDEPKADTTTLDPTKAPEPTKAPAPEPALMALKLKLDGAKVLVTWGGCQATDFWAYKVVRSDDDAATWPMGKGDALVGVVENAATLSFLDAKVALGSTYTYKVAALTKSGGEAVTACRTETGRITTPEPPKPTPGQQAAGFGVTLSTADGKVLVDWTACSAAGFDYYKVVRSKDSNVTFPGDGNDSVIAAVGPDGDTAAYDKGLPGGITLYYAVFCVDKTEAGYVVLGATNVASITTTASAPKPTPKPAPPVATMGFSVQSTAEGVVLSWEAFAGDGFSYYKVVRSRGDNPSYFPGTEGSEVIAVIENSGTTTFVDAPPEGGTWFYRIQAIGHWDGQKVLLGQTPALSVAL